MSLSSSAVPSDGRLSVGSLVASSTPLSLLSPARPSPSRPSTGLSGSLRSSISSSSLGPSSSAVHPYPTALPHSTDLHPTLTPPTLGSRHHRHHSSGSSSPSRRLSHSTADDDAAFPRSSSANSASVSLQIRSRGGDAGDGRGGRAAGHGRQSSDEDARGLKKGRKGQWWRLLSGLLLILTVAGCAWLWWASAAPETRSGAVTVLLPYLALGSGESEQEPSPAATLAADHLISATFASWLQVLLPSSILVYAESEADCAALTAAFPGVQCYPVGDCVSSVPPLPELTCVLSHAMSKANVAPAVVLLSTPLALDRRVLGSVAYASTNLPPDHRERWLMAGARTDVSLMGMAAREWSSEGFAARLFSEGQQRGVKHGEHALDALVVSRGLLRWALDSAHLPPFIAGAGHWPRYLFVQAMLDTTVAVIDMSLAVPLLHLQLVGSSKAEDEAVASPLLHFLRTDVDHPHDTVNAASSPPAAALARNHALVQQHLGVRVALASLSYCPLILEGDCPSACVISPNPEPLWQSALAFTQRVNPDGYLAVLTVNIGYLALARNWLCWAERIGFTHFILLAEDRRSAEALASPTVAVITRPHAPYQKEAADYGSVEFQETMSYRTEFLLDVLDVGYHFMTADMDAIWLSDPFVHVDPTADLSGQTHKKVKLSGGLVIVRATDAGKGFWKEVIRCQRNNAKFLAEHSTGTYEPSLYTEQYCINQLYVQQPPPPAFTRSLLDPWLFPDGLAFFEQQQPQHAGVVPVIIHNNWIRGSEAKLKRMREWGLTSADDTNSKCAALPEPPAPHLSAPATTPVGFSLIIRVVSRSSPTELTALLRSLASLECAGCGEVTLQVDVDRLPEVEDSVIEQTVARHATYQQLLEIASAFEWKQGTKVVREGKRRRGRMGQWLDGWPAAFDDRVVYLILDEQVQLSSELYPWLIRALRTYYLSDSVDARLMGLQLEREELVLSETYWSRWPHRSTSLLLPFNTSLYRYQSMSPHAQLMFPSAMQRFAQWIESHSVDHVTSLPPATTNNHVTPCIPLMVTNQWYLPRGDVQSEPEDVWWVWMQRWMYEEGLYSVVSHLPRGQALVTHPNGKVGLFLNRTARAPLLLPASASASLFFPPLSSLPLYSFGFVPISPPSLLSVLPQLSPPGLSVQCYSAEDYEEEQRLRLEAEERKRSEDELKARVAAESKAKKSISDAMRREKRKAEHSKAKEEEQKEARRPFAVELEGG